MKYTIVILLFAFSAVAYAQKKSGIDSIDVDQVLKNDRILTNYIKCLLDKGPCTSEGRDLKKTLPNTLQTNCADCSEKMRANTRRVIDHVKSRKPREWEELSKKYDPENNYVKFL